MNTPQAYRRGLKYARIFLVLVTLGLALSSNVQAQCAVSSPSPEKPAANVPKNGPGTKNAGTAEDANAPAKLSPNPTPSPSPTPFTLSIKDVKVPDDSRTAGLNDRLIIEVNCLKEELARQENPQNGVPAQERIDPKNFVLFLNQVEIKKLHPYAVDRELDQLHFRLRRDSDSRDAWQNFLSRPKNETVTVNASVGPEGKSPVKDAKPFVLRIYSSFLFNIGVAVFLLILVGFLIAARKTTIIRDSGPPNPAGGPRNRPYSLARTQVAWWFFIILGSFLFIGLVTWDLDTITTSSLVLLGIGTGTALGAAMVDANKRENSDKDLETLKPREAKLAASVAELKATIMEAEKIALGGDPALVASVASRRTELATLEAELEQVRSQVNDAASGLQRPESAGPFMDLLSDANGVTFHRFQIAVWTIVLGLIFIYSVWNSLTMPQFSETLLALMGISAGTYLGFKIPERQTDPRDIANMNTPASVNQSDYVASDADTDPQNEDEGC